MPIKSWVGKEPIIVTTAVESQIDSTFTIDTYAGVFGTVVWAGPQPNETWEIEAIQIEVSTSAVVGDRTFEPYIMDRTGTMFREFSIFAAAGSVKQLILQHGMPWSSNSFGVGDVGSSCYTGPLWVKNIDYPCKVGLLWTTFNDAGDIVRFRIMYRSRVQL
jgi:hypothetical protein